MQTLILVAVLLGVIWFLIAVASVLADCSRADRSDGEDDSHSI